MTNNYNTGDCNTGNYNTGDCNTGHRNTGHCNTGYCNTGYCNTGDCNTGYYNTGNYNTGHRNTGHRNTGNYNTGNYNTGHYNTGHYNTGYFNTATPENVTVFNNSDVSRKAFLDSMPDWLINLSLTEWVPETEMTERQKIDNPTFHITGGFILERSLQEAFSKAWIESDRDVDAVRAIAGFDETVWNEITGIDLGGNTEDTAAVTDEVITVFGVRYQRIDK